MFWVCILWKRAADDMDQNQFINDLHTAAYLMVQNPYIANIFERDKPMSVY